MHNLDLLQIRNYIFLVSNGGVQNSHAKLSLRFTIPLNSVSIYIAENNLYLVVLCHDTVALGSVGAVATHYLSSCIHSLL